MAVRIDQKLQYNKPEVRFDPPRLFTNDELWQLSQVSPKACLAFDVECYPNYWCVGFKCVDSDRCLLFERDERTDFDPQILRWVIENFCIVGFNSNNYDIPQLWAALAGCNNAQLKSISDAIVIGNAKIADLEKDFNFTCGFTDTIDIEPVTPAPGLNSLKLFGARTHAKILQELPYEINDWLDAEQKRFVALYNINDLDLTIQVFKMLREPIQLRIDMSLQYGIDLRSKSDAQVAEAVILSECESRTGITPRRPKKSKYRYPIQYPSPSWLSFCTPTLQKLHSLIQDTKFPIDENGKIELPDHIKNYELNIGRSQYQIGIGGLHSKEKKISWQSTKEYQIIDNDVASYYPYIILNSGMYPKSIGLEFLEIYRDIVERRIKAKKESKSAPTEELRKQAKSEADSLKIAANGSFGKLGSIYSPLYSPELMLQATLTGQLALLMLIEAAEWMGISIISANTDGIVAYCRRDRIEEYQQLISHWERETGFTTERTDYLGLYSASVNSYVAVVDKEPIYAKSKGKAFLTRKTMDEINRDSLMKSCQFEIAAEAVTNFLIDGTHIEKTILRCQDITKFVNFTRVRGGAEKYGTYLGKLVRWYVSSKDFGAIHRCDTGNMVPNTTGGVPIMVYPDSLPADLDYEWYIDYAKTLLAETGYWQMKNPQGELF